MADRITEEERRMLDEARQRRAREEVIAREQVLQAQEATFNSQVLELEDAFGLTHQEPSPAGAAAAPKPKPIKSTPSAQKVTRILERNIFNGRVNTIQDIKEVFLKVLENATSIGEIDRVISSNPDIRRLVICFCCAADRNAQPMAERHGGRLSIALRDACGADKIPAPPFIPSPIMTTQELAQALAARDHGGAVGTWCSGE
jgi:hypothetical protein